MNSYFNEISNLIGGQIAVTGIEVLPNSINQNIFVIMGLRPDDSICALASAIRTDGGINSRFITILPLDLAGKIGESTESRFPMPEPAPVREPVPDLSSSPVSNNSYDTSGSSGYGNSPFGASPDSSLSTQQPFTSLSDHPVSFSSFENTLTQEQLNNLRLLMNVPLELSIEIGSTQRRVDEILSFSHGTVIELDSPADAPVNVIVNGHLIAKGDVVVVDDYFAVRVTEIIKSNLIDTLQNGNF
jgi:flagellar motor switch protein FliN/FliY